MKKTDTPPDSSVILSDADVSCVIAMAWQDDTPFEAIALQFGLIEAEVISLMRAHLKTRSFKVWRMRVRGRAAKHQHKQHMERLNADQLARQTSAWTAQPSDPFPLPPSLVTPASLR